MKYEDVQSPKQLMQYLDENFEYGVINKKGEKFNDSSDNAFQKACKEWKLKPVAEIIKSGVGHCYDQTEIERDWFTSHGYMVKTFWVIACDKQNTSYGFSHAYIAYLENGKWYYFEHSSFPNKGIYEFDYIEELVNFQAQTQVKFAGSQHKPISGLYSVLTTEFDKPKDNITMKEYMNFVSNAKIVLNKDFKN